MVPPSSLKCPRSWSDGMNTSNVCWTDHPTWKIKPFTVFNRRASTIPRVDSDAKKAIDQQLSDKAAGADAIPADVYKADGTSFIIKFTNLFLCFWDKGLVSQEVKAASITHLCQRKGNIQICDNSRDISQLSIVEKILAIWTSIYNRIFFQSVGVA